MCAYLNIDITFCAKGKWPLFKMTFVLMLSFSKTGKLKTCSKITRPHLSLRLNKKVILKAVLNFFVSFLVSRQEMKSGLGEAPMQLE